MGRHPKYYVILTEGRASHIVTGSATMRLHIEAAEQFGSAASFRSFVSERAAEEWLCWWNYRYGRPQGRPERAPHTPTGSAP